MMSCGYTIFAGGITHLGNTLLEPYARSNQPQYCVVCRFLLVGHFASCNRGWLICQAEMSRWTKYGCKSVWNLFWRSSSLLRFIVQSPSYPCKCKKKNKQAVPYKTPATIRFVAVMHNDQRMEPEDRAFLDGPLVTSRDSVCEVP